MPKRDGLFLFHREQAKESVINHVGDTFEVLWVVLKVCCVTIYNHQMSFVGLNPLLITLIKSTKIVYTHRFVRSLVHVVVCDQ